MKIGRVKALAAAAPLLVAALVVLGMPAPLWAQAKDVGSIFTCTSADGRRLTSDRPIVECLDREQRVLNKDGSLRQILPPSLTPDERAAADEAERRKLQQRASKQEAIRRDRNLLSRFPSEPAHRKARDAALDEVRTGTRTSEQRLADLQKERKPLAEELQFYQGKQPPAKLRGQVDAIDVSVEAQRALIANQQVEINRVTALFDAELQRLKLLWGGAEPGSLGPLPQSAQAAASTPAAASVPLAAAKKPG